MTDKELEIIQAYINSPSPSAPLQRALRKLLKEHSKFKQAVSMLEELADLMDDVRSGDYTPDSYTTQPARILLKDMGE